jgi:HK97 gp10 family phage protein
LNNNIYIAPADLQKALGDMNKYSTDVQKGVQKEILTTAYAIVLKAKQNLTTNKSVKTGNLRAKLKVDKDLVKYQARAGTDVNYAAYLEFGTPPHIIRIKTKKVLARYTGTSKGIEGFEFFGKEVHHPGSKAKPFLFPAAESERPRYIQRIEKILSGPVK